MTIYEQIEEALTGATDGPWEVRKWSRRMDIQGNIHQVTDTQNYPTAFVPAWDNPGPEEIDGTAEAQSNARLIALAPVMARMVLDQRDEREAADKLAEAVANLVRHKIGPSGGRLILERDVEAAAAALAAYREARG